MKKELVVLGSPHLDLQTGGVISYITEITVGAIYGCGDTCVDIQGCSKCTNSYKGDILEYLKTRSPKSYVLFSTGVLEFTEKYDAIKLEMDRTCVANYTDYYTAWTVTWYVYGCSANNRCGRMSPGHFVYGEVAVGIQGCNCEWHLSLSGCRRMRCLRRSPRFSSMVLWRYGTCTIPMPPL